MASNRSIKGHTGPRAQNAKERTASNKGGGRRRGRPESVPAKAERGTAQTEGGGGANRGKARTAEEERPRGNARAQEAGEKGEKQEAADGGRGSRTPDQRP